MNISIDTKKRIVWLSYDYLLGHNVPEGTINWWSANGLCRRIYIDGRAFLDYETIPEPTRCKLPTKVLSEREFFISEERIIAIIRENHRKIRDISIKPIPKVRTPRISKTDIKKLFGE